MMGLRDRYIAALVARCVVAPPRECKAQQPTITLRIAPPRETQDATNDPVVAAAARTSLRATNYATAKQPAQHDDGKTTVERSVIVSADGVSYWKAVEIAGSPAWTDAEIATSEKRQACAIWLGYGNRADRVADMLLRRDRDKDDRRLCIECAHADPGWRCAKHEAFMVDQLQRCPAFQEITE
jgi:hypothetical protein